MAEKALAKLEEQLECAVCHDTYSSPKQLQCNHIYCQHCLEKLLERDQEDQLFISCPICRHSTHISDKGVPGLQTAFHINNLIEIYRSLLEIQLVQPPHAGPEITSGESVPACEIPAFCSEHIHQTLTLYCKTCEDLICLECVVIGARHHNHCYVMPKKAYSHYKEEIIPFLDPLKEQLTSINVSLTEVDVCSGEILGQQESIEAEIHSSIERIHEAIDCRKTELISQLHRITQRKLKSLSDQKDKMKHSQAQITYCLDTIEQSLDTQQTHDFPKIKSSLIEQVNELAAGFDQDMLTPHAKPDIIFLASKSEIDSLLEKYGQVIETENYPVPSKCYATGKGLETATVGEETTAVVRSRNSYNEPCIIPHKALDCVLISEITGKTLKCRAKLIGQCAYVISYKPLVKGKNQLHVRVFGEHIKGSPFPLLIKSSVIRLDNPLSIIKQVKYPWDVVINQKGNLLVTESSKNRVLELSPNGTRLRSFGSGGSKEGKFNNPRGITLDHDENIYITDSGNHRIQKFDSNGTFLDTVGKKAVRMYSPWAYKAAPLLFSHPKAIAFNACNKKLYVSDENNMIQIINTDLTFHGSFRFGKSVGVLYDCAGTIACDSAGKVYTADGRISVIQVFTAEGELVKSFGGEKWNLIFPVSITIDCNDLIYIGEHLKHRVCIFTLEGNIVKSFNNLGEDPEQYFSSRGLAVDKCGTVYVCSYDKDLIAVF